MKLKGIKHTAFTSIKVVSIVLMANAVGLELWNIVLVLTNNQFPSYLNPVLWIGRLAIAAHLIEAMIAVAYAPSKQKVPLIYGTYTFFVGTIGLLELFEKSDQQ